MKHKTLLKIIFDIIMLIIMVLTYSVFATGILLHEILGLGIFALFAIHLLYNRKWIVAVTKKLFNKAFNKKQKFMYVLNIALLGTMIMTGISGIVISRGLFNLASFDLRRLWTPLHTLFAMISLALVGVHVGLHWKMIAGVVKKYIPLPKTVGKILATSLAVALLGVAVYGAFTNQGGIDGGYDGGYDGQYSHGQWGNDEQSIMEQRQKWLEEREASGGSVEDFHAGHGQDNYGYGNWGNENQDRSAEDFYGSYDRDGFDYDGDAHGFQSFNLPAVITTLAWYIFLVLVFAVITYTIEKTLTKKKDAPSV